MIGDAPLVRLCSEEKGKELWLSPYLESLFSLYQYFVRLHFFFLIIKVRNVSVHTDF